MPLYYGKKLLAVAMGITLGATVAIAQDQAGESQIQSTQPVCAEEISPYTDFDFLIGEWDFHTPGGQKIADHTYTKREMGCLIIEEWRTLNGDTGFGIKFVDPATGLWRSVWMSPTFQIDYSGKRDESGSMVLEGYMFPMNDMGHRIIAGRTDPQSDRASAKVRGVWTPLADGTTRQEFLIFNPDSKQWETFFLGADRPKGEESAK